MMSSITYSLVTLTIDGVTPFLQNVRKNMHFSPNKSNRNSNSLFKMAESLKTEGFVCIFNLFVC